MNNYERIMHGTVRGGISIISVRDPRFDHHSRLHGRSPARTRQHGPRTVRSARKCVFDSDIRDFRDPDCRSLVAGTMAPRRCGARRLVRIRGVGAASRGRGSVTR
jgi:hypothetical protein